jgi:hypothetical protein
MTPWTPAEDAALAAEFSTETTQALAEKFGRSYASVKNRAARLGLKKTAEHRAQQLALHSRGAKRALSAVEMKAWLLENVRLNEDGCRIWAGCFASCNGSPTVVWNYKKVLARRLLAQLSGMDIRPRYVVWTSCGDVRCMNPEHFSIGTRAVMARSMKSRGAYCSGARRAMASAIGRAKNAKLPITERRTVLRMIADGATHKEVAAKYGVDFTAVSKALKVWERATGSAVDLGEAA